MYYPKQGDIVFLDFSPQSGHEQAGRRPGVVIS
ncbi:MAG: type II toxin-antitoxin system PemK/MazF family toxin, partial [Lachnospiraceae bacterium]|nr:type II toxin-antitoxin system PemK/MazF family toxin [Lachnospiraceae bacterium]